MKLLFLTPQLPYPPHQGTTIRNYHLLHALAQHHQIDLLSFTVTGEALPPTSPLHALCRRIATLPQPTRSLTRRAVDTLRSPQPDMALRLEEPQMHELVRQWVTAEQYDLIQVEGIEMAQYGLRVARGEGRGAQSVPHPLPLIFDDHNCEYLLQKRNALTDLRLPRRWLAAAYSLVQWQKLRYYEASICRRAAATLAVSEADRAALAEIAPERPITVIPNGIYLDDYPALGPGSSTPPYRLLFTGKMDYRPNIDAMLWFGRAVLPLIVAQEPQVRLQIVGMSPHPRLDELRQHPAVEITGAVPEIHPYMQAAAAYIIPMRVGGGTRFKALEAMAYGKGIVSTTLGVEGIAVSHNTELLLADSPADFAAAVLTLVRDHQQGGECNQRLGQRARAFVETHYSWKIIAPRLEQLYQTVTTSPLYPSAPN